MSKKRNDKESRICLMSKPSQKKKKFHNNWSFFLKIYLQKKSFLRKRRRGGLKKNRKEGFLTALTMTIKGDPTSSIRKHVNELKVHKKSLRRVIKQDLYPDLDPFLMLYGAF